MNFHGLPAPGADSRIAAHLPLAAVLAIGFFTRIWHLDYNGPFIDESFHAIAIEYGNVPYLTGEVFLYPLLSHFVHGLAGLLGARFVSAIFGTLTVGCVYATAEILARRFVEPGRERAVAFFSALAFGLSAPALFVSQFANYYALSFLFFAVGWWLIVRGTDSGSASSLRLGAVALVASAATRYLLLGYLPLALVWVAFRGFRTDAVRVPQAAFWLPFALGLAAYSGLNLEHIRAAVNHAQYSGTEMMLNEASGLRALVALEAIGRLAPVLALAACGLAFVATRSLRSAAPEARGRLLVLAWLALGAALMPLYHIATSHDLTLESNLTIAAMFAAVPAGLALEQLVHYGRVKGWRVAGWFVGAAVAIASVQHSAWILSEDHSWPDWRPVIAAASARGVDGSGAIWSTADNGGMLNTWGVRRAFAQMSGNPWQLRTEFGERVDVHSAWSSAHASVLLARAKREGVDYVIGPMPFRNLGVGDRLYGFIVTDIVVVPHGPEVHILRNAKLPD